MKKKGGFTLVELLTVLAIITMLVGLVIPCLTTVRRIARETKQRMQLAAIGVALTTFRNDFGDYPPSTGWRYDIGPPGGTPEPYCGAQKLSEALLGWDLEGFHPRSAWDETGLDVDGGPGSYDPDGLRGDATLRERKGRYLSPVTSPAFMLKDLYTNTGIMAPETYVLCDVFPQQKITIESTGQRVPAGNPILYYKAIASNVKLLDGEDLSERIYDAGDSHSIILLADLADDGTNTPPSQPLGNPKDTFINFYRYITDPRVLRNTWPYRPHSYLLITAGHDGIYGTADDICNFGL